MVVRSYVLEMGTMNHTQLKFEMNHFLLIAYLTTLHLVTFGNTATAVRQLYSLTWYTLTYPNITKPARAYLTSSIIQVCIKLHLSCRCVPNFTWSTRAYLTSPNLQVRTESNLTKILQLNLTYYDSKKKIKYVQTRIRTPSIIVSQLHHNALATHSCITILEELQLMGELW